MPVMLDAGDIDWQNRAACAGADLAVFVPAHETEHGLADARQHCDPCPVRAECLMWAMLHRCEGYWGATSTYQRQQLLRVRTRAKCPLCLSTSLVFADPHELCLSCGASWVRDVRLAPLAATPAPASAA